MCRIMVNSPAQSAYPIDVRRIAELEAALVSRDARIAYLEAVLDEHDLPKYSQR